MDLEKLLGLRWAADGAGGKGGAQDEAPKNDSKADAEEKPLEDGDVPDWAKDPKRAVAAKRAVDAEAKQHREAAAAAKKQAEELAARLKQIEDETLKKQGDFQKLYESAEQELKALRAAEEETKRYKEQFAAMFEARMKNVPKHIAELLKDRDPLQALAWLDSNADKLTAPPAPNLNGGNQSKPPSDDFLGSEEHLKRARQRFRLRR